MAQFGLQCYMQIECEQPWRKNMLGISLYEHIWSEVISEQTEGCESKSSPGFGMLQGSQTTVRLVRLLGGIQETRNNYSEVLFDG